MLEKYTFLKQSTQVVTVYIRSWYLTKTGIHEKECDKFGMRNVFILYLKYHIQFSTSRVFFGGKEASHLFIFISFFKEV